MVALVAHAQSRLCNHPARQPQSSPQVDNFAALFVEPTSSTMTSRTLPYFADEATFPEKLPTMEKIESAIEILSNTTGRTVVGIGVHFVVKYGVQVNLLEGETILFLEQTTTIPLPRIYALFQSPDKSITYIIMERIRGPSLGSEWPKMDEKSKETVSSKLQMILEEMRQLESLGGFCSVNHQGLPDGLFWTDDPTNPFAGPFNTEPEFNKAVITKYVESGLSRYKANYYSRTFKDILQNHPPVFTHGDFQRKNILIRNSRLPGEEEVPLNDTDIELVIIDWEFAGWYPSYWEYAKAIFACGRWDDDWNDWVDQILEPFRNENAWMGILLRELWS